MLRLPPRLTRTATLCPYPTPFRSGDFRSLIEAVQRKGVRASVVSTIRSSPPMIADELRRQADQFIDLDQLADDIERVHADRPPRRERMTAPPVAAHSESTDDDAEIGSASCRESGCQYVKISVGAV